MQYSTLDFLKGLKESEMTISAKLIRDSMLNNTFPGQIPLSEAAADIVSISLVKEPHGTGVSVKQKDGHEYRYAAYDTNTKYNTPEKLLAAAEKLLKFRSSGAVLGWLSRNAILYYGSKRGKVAEFPKESLSQKALRDLESLIKELNPDYSKKDIKEAAEAFLEDLNIHSDEDYYRLGPNKIRRLL